MMQHPDFIRYEISAIPDAKRDFFRYLAFKIAAAKLPRESTNEYSDHLTDEAMAWLEQFIDDAVYFWNNGHADKTTADEVFRTLSHWWRSDIQLIKKAVMVEP